MCFIITVIIISFQDDFDAVKKRSNNLSILNNSLCHTKANTTNIPIYNSLIISKPKY